MAPEVPQDELLQDSLERVRVLERRLARQTERAETAELMHRNLWESCIFAHNEMLDEADQAGKDWPLDIDRYRRGTFDALRWSAHLLKQSLKNHPPRGGHLTPENQRDDVVIIK